MEEVVEAMHACAGWRQTTGWTAF